MRIRLVLSVLVTILIEVFAFNFSALWAHIEGVSPLILSDEQFTYLNWEEIDGQRLSLPDPILYVEGLEVQIRSMEIELDAHPMPQIYTIFYTLGREEAFSDTHMLTVTADSENRCIKVPFPLMDKIYALRVDLGEEAGTYLDHISIHINEFKWDISLARILAMLVIYWGATGLMRLQKSPDYGLDTVQKGLDEDEA